MRHIKLFSAIMIFILLPCCLWAVTEIPYTPFLVIGHIDSSVSLSVSIDDSVLPVDFTSDSVKYNSNPSVNAAGLKFGYYSVVSNVNFDLYIAHTPFVLRTPTEANDGSKIEQIDYVLYAISDMSTGEFSYCYSNPNAANPAQITETNGNIVISKVARNNLARMIEHSLFLSLVDEDVNNLRAGIYESTIYFVLETE